VVHASLIASNHNPRSLLQRLEPTII
jgi:hypothetical protein